MTKPVLIFPAGMPRSLAYLQRAQAEGRPVIGSSSLGYDPAREHYSQWVHLPYITDPDFDQTLRRVVADFDIGGIFSPNPVVWDYLHRCLPDMLPGVELVNSSPLAFEVAPYQSALQFGASVFSQPMELAGSMPPRPSVSALEIASLFRHADVIPGMCNNDKIHALCEAFRYSPVGDVVEIGSWWGKSAFALARLARCYGVGNLLCVDPWSKEHLFQKEEKGLVNRVVADTDEALTVFQLNLLPYAHGAVNYLRLPSVDAAVEYRRDPLVTSAEFGETRYEGRVAVLHVDGNHDYVNVKKDIIAWGELVVPGGWIIMDDYVWPYGDGPRKVGDEFLDRHLGDISCAFVMGTALFIQKK